MTDDVMSDADINRLYGAIRSVLNGLSVQNIRNTAAAAGIDVTKIPSTSEASGGHGSRAEVMPSIDQLFGRLPKGQKIETLRILADELVGTNDQFRDDVQAILGKHGYQFINGQFVPVGAFDAREVRFLPPSAASELARAAARLADGDWSGAITSASGAVDLTTQAIYEREGLGDPGKASFQTKVNTALKHLRVFEDMEQEFVAQGMKPADAKELVDQLRQATNHAAQALQVLRRAMGDTHGSRPAIQATAYDAVKWAAAISALFEGR